MRHTKHESLTGRKPLRCSELDLPTKAEMRQIRRWLGAQPDRTELPKQNNIEERKRKNRARARAREKACLRVLRWQQTHREEYNAKMRAYRKKRRLAAKGEEISVGGEGR